MNYATPTTWCNYSAIIKLLDKILFTKIYNTPINLYACDGIATYAGMNESFSGLSDSSKISIY